MFYHWETDFQMQMVEKDLVQTRQIVNRCVCVSSRVCVGTCEDVSIVLCNQICHINIMSLDD